MCIALPAQGKFPIVVNAAELITRHKSVRGTMTSNLADVDKTLELARQGKLRLKPEVIGLSRINEGVQRLKRGEVVGRIVVDFNLDD